MPSSCIQEVVAMPLSVLSVGPLSLSVPNAQVKVYVYLYSNFKKLALSIKGVSQA